MSDCSYVFHTPCNSYTTPTPFRCLCGGQLHHSSLRGDEEMGEGPSSAQLALTLTLNLAVYREVGPLQLLFFSTGEDVRQQTTKLRREKNKALCRFYFVCIGSNGNADIEGHR
jgi:hypothetical protein